MCNPVVEAIVRVYQQKGFSSLRFDFRGVGLSEGAYDQGKGEQTDVRSAVAFLASLGVQQVDLAGYSFGSWVNAHLQPDDVYQARLIMVSPPVALMPFDGVSEIKNLGLVVTGSEDEFAPPELIRKMLVKWNPTARFEVIDGADHFFWGSHRELEAVLSAIM
jgi:alpha/beta superfamily hydrolase